MGPQSPNPEVSVNWGTSRRDLSIDLCSVSYNFGILSPQAFNTEGHTMSESGTTQKCIASYIPVIQHLLFNSFCWICHFRLDYLFATSYTLPILAAYRNVSTHSWIPSCCRNPRSFPQRPCFSKGPVPCFRRSGHLGASTNMFIDLLSELVDIAQTTFTFPMIFSLITTLNPAWVTIIIFSF